MLAEDDVTRPPTVSISSPTGSSRLERLLQPVHADAARHHHAPSASTAIGSPSTSYSSLISPTSSSTMSSILTTPAVPPYSSIATANVMRLPCNSFSSSAIFLVSGTRNAGRTSGGDGRLRTFVVHQVAHRHDAHDVVEVLAVDREAAVLRSRATAGAGRPTGARRRWPRCRAAASSRRAPASPRSGHARPPAGPRPRRARAAAALSAPDALAAPVGDSCSARLRRRSVTALHRPQSRRVESKTGSSTSSERSGFWRTSA